MGDVAVGVLVLGLLAIVGHIPDMKFMPLMLVGPIQDMMCS